MSGFIFIALTVASFFGPIWMRSRAARQERDRRDEELWNRAARLRGDMS